MTDDARRTLRDYDQMGDAYADDADTDPIKASYDRPAMVAMAGDVRGLRVLDAGCASGVLAELLVAGGATVVGVDLNPRLVERARQRLGLDADLHVADLSTPMPFLASGSFDMVTASLVLHYIADWEPALREFARVLRPGGLLLISTHHPIQTSVLAEPPTPYFDTVLLADRWTKGGREHVVHYYHRPLSAIVDSLADAGFLVERIPEPIPDPRAFAGRPRFYERVGRGPWFLFIRAVKAA
jgi:SAM-dependent methyltransferase